MLITHGREQDTRGICSVCSNKLIRLLEASSMPRPTDKQSALIKAAVRKANAKKQKPAKKSKKDGDRPAGASGKSKTGKSTGAAARASLSLPKGAIDSAARDAPKKRFHNHTLAVRAI